jgi:hypothetical protein
MESPYFIVDMGSHVLKNKVPDSMQFQYVGVENKPRQLPALPVQYYSRATVYRAYTRDLHMRCLYFDMLEIQATASSFCTAPGAMEFLSGQSCPYMVCMCVAGEWNTTTKVKQGARHTDHFGRTLERRAVHRRCRYFHVRHQITAKLMYGNCNVHSSFQGTFLTPGWGLSQFLRQDLMPDLQQNTVAGACTSGDLGV